MEFENYIVKCLRGEWPAKSLHTLGARPAEPEAPLKEKAKGAPAGRPGAALRNSTAG